MQSFAIFEGNILIFKLEKNFYKFGKSFEKLFRYKYWRKYKDNTVQHTKCYGNETGYILLI